MGFWQAIQYGFRHWADFEGRCPRSAFWWWMLFYFLLGLYSLLVEHFLWGSNISGWLIALFLFIPTLSLSVRRFHDTGLSGKIVLFEYIIGFPVMVSSPFDDKFYDMTYDNIYAITFVGLFCLLVAVISIYVLIRCGFYKTQKGENKYGAALEVAKL